MFCTACGQSVSDDEKFCHTCGRPVTKPIFTAGTVPPRIPNPAVTAPTQISNPAVTAPTQISNPAVTVPTQIPNPAAPVTVPGANEIAGNNVNSANNIASPAESADVVTAVQNSPAENPQYIPPENAAFVQTEVVPPIIAPAAQPAESVGAAKPKKKRRFLPWIIAGASAAVVGAGALIWFLNTSAVLHTFMGDSNYAASVIDNYVNDISKNSGSLTSLFLGNNAAVSDSDNFNELAVSTANKLFDVFDTKELGLTFRTSVEPKNMFKDALSSAPDIAEALDELGGLALKLDLSSSEDALDTMATLSSGGSSINAAVRVEPEAILVMTPAVNDTVLKSEKSAGQTPPKYIMNADEQEENLSRLYDTFIKYYKNSDFYYESGNVEIGNENIGCTVITAVLEGDNLTDMLSDIGDIICDISGAVTNPFEDFDADDSNAMLTIESYVTAQNRTLGLTITISGSNPGTGNKSSASVTVKNSDNALYADLKLGKVKAAELEYIGESSGSGTVTLKFTPDSNSDESVTIIGEITESGTAEVFGQKLPAGKCSITVKGSGLDRYLSGQQIILGENNTVSAADFIRNSSIDLELSEAKNGYDIELDFYNKDLGNFSFSLDIQPKISEKIPDFSDSRKVLNADDNSEEAASAIREYTAGVLAAAEEFLSDKSIDALGRIALDSGSLNNMFEEMESKRRRVEVYSGYNDNTISEASQYAKEIYSKTKLSKFFSRELQTIKLFFDKNGTLKVLDSANEIESVIKSMYGSLGIREAYIEIVIHIDRDGSNPIGVTVVKTSDSSKIPSVRPNEYDMLERVYDWQYPNIIDDYAVGTYPSLLTRKLYQDIYGSNKDTAKEKDEKLAQKISQLNRYAKRVNDAFTYYLSATGNRITSSSTDGLYISVDEKGKWTAYSLNNYFAYNVQGYSNNILTYFENTLYDIKDCVFTIMLYKGQYVGVAARESYNESGYISSMEFRNGFSDWSYIDGLSGNTCYGTYPELRRINKSDYATVLRELNGTWKNGNDRLIINSSTFDLDKIMGEIDIRYSYLTFRYGDENHYYVYKVTFDSSIERAEYVNGDYKGTKTYNIVK